MPKMDRKCCVIICYGKYNNDLKEKDFCLFKTKKKKKSG